MSDRPNQSTVGDDAHRSACDEVRDLAEGYVLDAVEPFERARVDAHLEQCAECRALITELGRVVAYLPFLSIGDSTEQLPSPRAKTAFMARVTSQSVSMPTLLLPRQEARAVSVPQAALVDRADRFSPALTLVPMAAAVMLALVWAFSLQNDLNEKEDLIAANQQFNLATYMSTATGPGKPQMYSFTPMCSDCGHGKLKIDSKLNLVQLYAGDLDPNLVHEAWVIGGDGDWEKLGELNVSDSGDCMEVLQLDRSLHTYRAIVISSAGEDGDTPAATPELMLETLASRPPPGAVMMVN